MHFWKSCRKDEREILPAAEEPALPGPGTCRNGQTVGLARIEASLTTAEKFVLTVKSHASSIIKPRSINSLDGFWPANWQPNFAAQKWIWQPNSTGIQRHDSS